MMFLAKLFSAIGSLGSIGTVGCAHWFIDEPKMPRSLIEK